MAGNDEPTSPAHATEGQTSRTASPTAKRRPAIPLDPELAAEIDEDFWGKRLEPEDILDVSEQRVATFISFLIQCWRAKGLTGRSLWWQFHSEFEDWTAEAWNAVPKWMHRYLRSFLLSNGVFVTIATGLPMARALEEAAKREEFRPWTPEEVAKQRDKDDQFEAFLANPVHEESITRTASLPRPRATTPVAPALIPPTQPGREATETYSYRAPERQPRQPIPPREAPPTRYTPPDTSYRMPQPPPGLHGNPQAGTTGSLPWMATPEPYSYQGPYWQPPTAAPRERDLTSKYVTDLQKIYEDDVKYSGGLYHVMTTKLKIFRDYCNRLSIPQSAYAKCFPAMLKDAALSFYFNELSGRGLDFNELTAQVEYHFETEEGRQGYLTEWQQTRLPQLIA
ncbi:hypothetical protein GE09DRAFT_724945 [Coniochaeta sp. 2T2.1]|nr:hypothetical protein GE09DRAFT_724945 [Coniochaeta sp. 2T2.1]